MCEKRSFQVSKFESVDFTIKSCVSCVFAFSSLHESISEQFVPRFKKLNILDRFCVLTFVSLSERDSLFAFGSKRRQTRNKGRGDPVRTRMGLRCRPPFRRQTLKNTMHQGPDKTLPILLNHFKDVDSFSQSPYHLSFSLVFSLNCWLKLYSCTEWDTLLQFLILYTLRSCTVFLEPGTQMNILRSTSTSSYAF
jgi:hypothetical protein